MICPECNIVNPDELDVCYNCRTPLHPKRQSKAIWFWSIILVIAIAGGAGYFYLYRMPPPPRPNQTQPAAPKAQKPVSAPVKAPATRSAEAPPSVPPSDQPVKPQDKRPASKSIKLTTGQVFIKDVTGKQLTQIPVAVIADGWVALPKSVCIGGYEWRLLLVSGKEFGVAGGIVDDLAPIGLWRISDDQNVQGAALYPWAAGKATAWYSLNSKESLESVTITVISEEGDFINVEPPAGLVEPGVFVQNDRVVGWTFGSLEEGAFLWKGSQGKNLKVELGVDDFYRLTFANSREEEFLLALALDKEYSDLERLAALVNGFRFEPKLSPGNTPDNLQQDAILDNMRRLISRLEQNGLSTEVANTFDAEVLVRMADVELIRDVVQTTQEGYGHEEAVQLLEDVVGQMSINNKADADQLKEFHSGLYQNWISSLTENDDPKAALRAFELGRQNLPDDLEIHLLGVELALAEGNWEEAEKLLLMKEYPSALRNRVLNLSSRISELKGQAGKIVIRFEPGSSQIPVTANLDQNVQQKFVVDTGASLVTIPQATAEKLDITVDDSSPLRTVSTAGGTVEAPEVVIPMIEINGWEVRDVRALVMDIPNQPEMGLLGLNFLERFRMDLDSERGILLLEPR